MVEGALGKDERLVPVLLAIAQLELARAPAAAGPFIDRAVALGEQHGGPAEVLAEATFMQAKVALAAGDRKRARERASKAAAMFTALAMHDVARGAQTGPSRRGVRRNL